MFQIIDLKEEHANWFYNENMLQIMIFIKINGTCLKREYIRIFFRGGGAYSIEKEIARQKNKFSTEHVNLY